MAAALEAIRYTRGSLKLLDQRLLPGQMVYLPIEDAAAAHDAIVTMLVRGAPAIAICAALAVAVELHASAPFETGAAAASFVSAKLDYLVTSRPTAVNLSEIAARLKRVAAAAVAQGAGAVVASVVRRSPVRRVPSWWLTPVRLRSTRRKGRSRST